jgi:hypothetical protein
VYIWSGRGDGGCLEYKTKKGKERVERVQGCAHVARTDKDAGGGWPGSGQGEH